MKEKKIEKIFDELLWTLFYALPLVAYLVYLRGGGVDGFMSFIADNGFNVLNNDIFTNIKSVFGTGGLYPLVGDAVLYYMVYFVCVYLVHVVVDVLLFLPRWAHKLIDRGFKNEK